MIMFSFILSKETILQIQEKTFFLREKILLVMTELDLFYPFFYFKFPKAFL